MKNVIVIIAAVMLLASAASAQLVLTGIVDGDLTGGLPKCVELRALTDIADLSAYGLGAANNGGGTDGEEFTFPADAVNAGDFIYVASEVPEFTAFFGFAPDYTTSAMGINGDDAVELFHNGTVIDVFGDPDVNGDGEVWDYTDGWAYRVSSTNAAVPFDSANWMYSGLGGLDGESTNDTAANPVPIGTYSNPVSNTVDTMSGIKVLFR